MWGGGDNWVGWGSGELGGVGERRTVGWGRELGGVGEW